MAQKPQHDQPFGMEPYDLGDVKLNDLGALSDEQQQQLNQFKIETRLENEIYLREHPEVECLLAGFLSEVFLKQPDNIREFAAEHFTEPELKSRVNEELNKRQALMKQNKLLKEASV